ncbi:MAG TPA: LysR family transcriptional regulator [Actinospica sp.]|nr:LysR family transcriptional regulator [Actinospica sp.]
MADVGGIDLNLLVALGALLEHRNLTRAGLRIGLSQPAMSAALSRLRRHFGDELLERDGRGYRLTPLGAQLLPTVQEALRQMEATMDRSPEFDPEASDREFSIAASDYTVSILADPLLRRVKQAAPGIRLELHPIPIDMSFSAHGIVKHDVVVGPAGYDFPGRRLELFRDRFVCVVDPSNPRLRDGGLSLADLSELPHAVPTFGHEQPTPADRMLDSLGIQRHVQVTVVGWLTVPFVVAGTGLIAIVPERLARRVADTVRLAIVEPPFGQVDLIETAHWHPSRGADPAVRWLLRTLQETAAQL